MSSTTKAPDGLGKAGKALWKSITSELGDDWMFDQRESEVLAAACRQRDDLDRLEAAITSDGAMVTGSAGQPVLHPAMVEARQARLALGRLLGQLHLPDEDDQPRTEAGKRGQKAANARWARRAAVERRRASGAA